MEKYLKLKYKKETYTFTGRTNSDLFLALIEQKMQKEELAEVFEFESLYLMYLIPYIKNKEQRLNFNDLWALSKDITIFANESESQNAESYIVSDEKIDILLEIAASSRKLLKHLFLQALNKLTFKAFSEYLQKVFSENDAKIIMFVEKEIKND